MELTKKQLTADTHTFRTVDFENVQKSSHFRILPFEKLGRGAVTAGSDERDRNRAVNPY